MRLVARQVVTAAVFATPGGRLRPLALLRRGRHTGPACWSSTARSAVDVRVGDRTATEIVGDGDVLQPLAGARRRPARARVDLARARAGAPRPARRRVRRARQAVAADLARAAHPRLRARGRPGRAARDHVAAAPRGAADAAALASRRPLGAGRARRHPARACRSRTACSGGSSAPSGPRSRMRSRASRTAGSSRAATARCTCTARPTSTSRRFADRPGARRDDDLRSTAGRRSAREAHGRLHGTRRGVERLLVHVLWLTSGLSCDGESVSLTAATNPSLEELLRGAIPGQPRIALYNPLLAYDVGDDYLRAWHAALRAASSSRSCSSSRARSPTRRSTARATGRASASTPTASRSPPAPGSTGSRRAPRRCSRSARARPTAASRRCATTRPARWGCATTSATTSPRGAGRR